MHYYKLFLPDGKTWRLEIGTLEERKKVADELIERWKPYCLNGWDKDDGDVYSPANKVKRFLNSLAYYLLFDDTEGIVTDYKEQMTGKREIPISSCPEIEDAMYSSSSVPKQTEQDWILRQLPEEGKEQKPVKKTPKKETRWDRIQRSHEVHRGFQIYGPVIVDTENKFTFQGARYMIDTKLAPQYSANSEEVYGMDRIWVMKKASALPIQEFFYDQEFFEIPLGAVKRIS